MLKKMKKKLLILLAVLVVAGAVLAALGNFYTEYLWFEHLKFGSVFTTRLLAQISIGVVFGLVAFVFLGVHILLVKRFSKPRAEWTFPTAAGEVIDLKELVRKVSTPVVVMAAVVVAVVMGYWASMHWEDVLKYLNQTSFGVKEPILEQDIGFYLFVLPTMQFVQEWMIYLTGLCLLLSAVVYFLRGSVAVKGRFLEMELPVQGHLLFGIACILLVLAWGWRIEMFETLFSKRGVAYGATYTDVHVNLIAFRIMIGACVACAVFMIYLIFSKPRGKNATKHPGYALAAVVVLYLLTTFVWAWVVEKFVVDPNELDKERPYLVHAIDGTRKAYGLDRIVSKEFPANVELTIDDLEQNKATIDNIKIWDHGPLKSTYKQLQVIRLYYDFPSVGVDRYQIGDRYLQVMLSARELFTNLLPKQSQTWVNEHLKFTHGYGVCLSPVRYVGNEGLPVLWVKDIPPVSPPRFGFSAKKAGDQLSVTSIDEEAAGQTGLQVGDRVLQIDEVMQPAKILSEDGELVVQPDDPRWKGKLHGSGGTHRLRVLRDGEEKEIDVVPERFDQLEITRPEIYYGQATDDFVLVKTTTKEFDYPKGDENRYTIYEGSGGVGLGTFFRRLLFAIRMTDVNLVFTRYLTEESRILFNRNIQQRVAAVAPFLMLDQEPYLTVVDDRLFWVQDAYTISYRYPYSQPTKLAKRARINYIRNSVKVVVDAFHGKMDLYIWDEKDPMIQTYAKIFPDLFKPGSTMPDELRKHVRYPKDLFTIQSVMYESFHMTDPQVWYNQEDKWDVSRERGEKTVAKQQDQPKAPGVTAQQVTQTSRMAPYYMIMKLPEEKREEFLLMVPFTPKGKDNMVAWMTGRCDGDNYGKLLVYTFPKKKLIFGPMQIEARIDQNNHISQWITLRDQKGSKVTRGDLLVIPIEDSILYVEPVYLEAIESQLPELKQVIVSFGQKLTMKNSLRKSLYEVFGVKEEPTKVAKKPKPGQPTPPPSGMDAARDLQGAQKLVVRAMGHYRAAQDKVGKGDWAGYGAEQKRLKQVLDALAKTLETKLKPRRQAPAPAPERKQPQPQPAPKTEPKPEPQPPPITEP